LIAAIAEIDLQGFDRAPAQGRKSADREKGQSGVHLVFLRLIVLPWSSASGVSLQRIQAPGTTVNTQAATPPGRFRFDR